MARIAEDVVVPSGGDVYQAPIGTALPTDLTSPPPDPWENIGFLSDDNPPTITGLQRDSTDLFAWNVDTPLRSALAPAAPLIQMELLQVESEDALSLFFGGGTWTENDPSVYDAPSLAAPEELMTIIDVVDGSKLYRMMFPRTTTRANGDMSLGRGAFVTMPIAMSVLAPSTGPWLRVLIAPNDAAPVPPAPITATGATSGAPGTFTPSGAETPADLGALDGITASPATAWDSGDYVDLDDGSTAYWDGSAWAEGEAP